MTDPQKHLQQVLEQQKELVSEVRELDSKIALKRELYMKLQGVVEYLQQTGVTLPEVEEEVQTVD
jgi:hypothetical protein